MVVGLELTGKYAQICVKNETMQELQSLSTVAGMEKYPIPVPVSIEEREQFQEFVRKLIRLLKPYGNLSQISHLVVCLQDNEEKVRLALKKMLELGGIPEESIHFAEKKECFCAYVFGQSMELSAHSVLLIEKTGEEKQYFLMHKGRHAVPVLAEVTPLFEEDLQTIFSEHSISSVFLVGEDFEQSWMDENLKLLTAGRRVFTGKNLFVKGAGYKACELAEGKSSYLYLGENVIRYSIGLKAINHGKEEFVTVLKAGTNWYAAKEELEVLLPADQVLELCAVQIGSRNEKVYAVHLKELPKRPRNTTRLRLNLEFTDTENLKVQVRDLGFGELFPSSEMVYEKHLRMEG